MVAVARESAAELQSLQASLKAAESLQGLAVAASRPPVQPVAAYRGAQAVTARPEAVSVSAHLPKRTSRRLPR